MKLAPSGRDLPESAEDLLELVNRPSSVALGLAAVEKLGQLYGQDLQETAARVSPEEFSAVIKHMGAQGDPVAIRSFILHAIPLRREVGRLFGTRSPDVAMMVDLMVMSYWNAIQIRGLIVSYLSSAMKRPEMLKGVVHLEHAAERETGQFLRLMDALRRATGRSIHLDPDRDVATLLRFGTGRAAVGDGERRRRVSRG